MIINIKKTAIYGSIQIYILLRSIFKIVAVFLIFGTLVSIFILPLLAIIFKTDTNLRGLIYFFLGNDLIFLYLYLFFHLKLKHLNTQLYGITRFEDRNLAEFLSFEASLPLYFAQDASKDNLVDSRSFFAYLLKTNPDFTSYVFERLGVDFNETRKNFKKYLGSSHEPEYTEQLEKIMGGALKRALDKKHEYIEISDILHGFIFSSDFIRESLFQLGVEPDDISAVVSWKEIKMIEKRNNRKFWEKGNMLKHVGLGKDLIFGYTPSLDRYSTDLTRKIRYMKSLKIIGHSYEIDEMGRILARSGQNNILLIGEPGGGRKTMLYGLTQRIAFGQSEPELSYKRVLILNVNALLAGLKTKGEISERMEKALFEAQHAGNIILAIDNFADIASTKEDSINTNIAPLLMPYLKSNNFQLIGICDHHSFHQFIEPNKDLFSQFEKVEVKETTQEETFIILQNLTPKIEREYGIMITIQSLREIIKLSDLYVPNATFPEKAIKLLSETAVFVAGTKNRRLLPIVVAEYFSKKTGAPLGIVKEEEKEKLLNMEEYLHKRVIGQHEAIFVISDALRRARAGLEEKKRPIGTFLFFGPTGVGKTETAKALAEAYFGSEDKVVRFDMSEYSDATALEQLIGSVQKNMPGYLSSKILENPFSIVLFDELEKVHKSILDLFLQILDEGYFTDSFGQKISFISTIIIATSNAGAEYLRQLKNQNTDNSKIKSMMLNHVLETGVYRPEFINRFDATVVFDFLSKEDVLKIAELMLIKLKKRIEGNGYFFIITPDLVQKMADIGFDPIFGGRALRRIIQEKVEGKIAREILEGKYKRGQQIIINPLEIEDM